MRKALFAVGALIALLAAGAGALYAYDASSSDVIAKGVTVAGIDVGGMTREEARAKVERELLPRAERPVTIQHGKKTFIFSPGEARMRTDAGAMTLAALEESRDGNFLGRAFRKLFGGTVPADVPLELGYSREAVRKFAARVDRAVARRARDAKVVPTATRLRVVRSQAGVSVRMRALVRAIEAELRRADGERVVDVPTETTKPKVTTRDLGKKYKNYITISRTQKKLRLFERLKLTKVYEVAIGQLGYSTPAGLYEIETKAVNPAWHAPDEPWAGELAGTIVPPASPDNPIRARWMEFFNGAGIHGTDDVASIGTAASHGCIRMTIPDVIELYDRIPEGTPVYIG